MIRPALCLIIGRYICLIVLKVPFRFVSMTASKSSSVILIIRLSFVIPALFTRISICPKAASISVIICPQASKSATLHCTATAFLPIPAISATTSSAFSFDPL